MRECFADTFFFVAILIDADPCHQRAREAFLVDRPVVTSAWVLLELGDQLCDARNRLVFGRVLQAMRDDPRYEIIPADQQVLDRAVSLYLNRADKDWSLTDCTSFVLMRDRGITDVLTGDRHFEQAGFTLLLK